MSPGRDQDYFSDGIAEEILNALAHVPELRVVGRTSSFSFKGKSEDLRTIGRKLDAATVLEGSVRREGGRIRITAQLVKSADGYHIWSETYDREAGGVFQVQGEIARAVVAALVPKLVGTRSGAPTTPPATSPEAYNQYLLGRQFKSRTAESQRRAAQAFERALVIDSSYAPAWAGLADALYLGSILGEGDPAPLVKRALAAADQAVELAPALAAGYIARCLIRGSLWEWDGANADAERAVALEPGSAESRRRLAIIVWEITGDPAPAVEQLRHATKLDPLSSSAWQLLGEAYFNMGRLDSARDAFRRALEIDPDQQWALGDLVKLELKHGNFEEAQRLAARVELPSGRMYWEAVLARARGEKQAARDAVAAFAARYGATMPADVASLHLLQGDNDLAFEWLERAVSLRGPELRWLRRSSSFRPLHGDPRWRALLKRMNLPVD